MEEAENPLLSGHQIHNPVFSLDPVGAEFSALRMQTFRREFPDLDDLDFWQSFPREGWPIIALFAVDGLSMFPIHRNPRALRYMSPAHGLLHTLKFPYAEQVALPNNVADAQALLEATLPWGLVEGPLHSSMGLVKELGPVWRALIGTHRCDTLVVTPQGVVSRDRNIVTIPEKELRQLKSSLARVERRAKKRISGMKDHLVMAELLTKTDPDHYSVSEDGTVLITGGGAHGVEQRRAEPVPSSAEVEASLDAATRNVKRALAKAPQALQNLHAEIELATLDSMIETYDKRLASDLSEPNWQAFFEGNLFVLKLVFARPVRLLHTQFHARPAGLSGAGSQVGDFLLAEHGQALAIIEIKRPSTELLAKGAYRSPSVYAPSKELSGAITQTLHQQSELRQRWHQHRSDDPSLAGSKADVIRCIVLAGRKPQDPNEYRSFEIFRHACKDVDVITYDELLDKMKLMRDALQAPAA